MIKFIYALLLIVGIISCKKDDSIVTPEPPVVEKKTEYYVGLRRSHYGYPSKNTDDDWWADRAVEFANSISTPQKKAIPVIIQIISGYEGEKTRMMFAKPSSYTGTTTNMIFSPAPAINHARALSVYQKKGVKAILQFESANADVLNCIEVAHAAFGNNECIIGYGVDAEWYRTIESIDQSGVPITDVDSEKWMNKILSLNKDYTMFLKHWETQHMPPKYRHNNLWYLDDSQIFPNFNSMINEFKVWGATYPSYQVGFQFGYESDRTWWSLMSKPAVDMTKSMISNIPNAKFFFWVDFTAGEVQYK